MIEEEKEPTFVIEAETNIPDSLQKFHAILGHKIELIEEKINWQMTQELGIGFFNPRAISQIIRV